MARINDMTFNVGLSISPETVDRCRILLSMFLTDNPDFNIEIHTHKSIEGNTIREVEIIRDVNNK